MKTAVIRARVPERLKEAFEAMAAEHGWNLSQAVRQLMSQHVSEAVSMCERRRKMAGVLKEFETAYAADPEQVLKWLAEWGAEDVSLTSSVHDILDVLDRIRREQPSSSGRPRSCYDRMKEDLGCIDGPEDLSTRKSHMDGYGR